MSLSPSKRSEAVMSDTTALKQPKLERIICSARDELMRELGLEEVQGE